MGPSTVDAGYSANVTRTKHFLSVTSSVPVMRYFATEFGYSAAVTNIKYLFGVALSVPQIWSSSIESGYSFAIVKTHHLMHAACSAPSIGSSAIEHSYAATVRYIEFLLDTARSVPVAVSSNIDSSNLATAVDLKGLLSAVDSARKHYFLAIVILGFLLGLAHVIYLCFFHPLARFPGPPLAKVTNGHWYYTILGGRGPWRNYDWHKKWGQVVRIAPNHLSFNTHSAQKVIYGFGTRAVPSMIKDPIFFTPEVDHSMNIINEVDREEHSRMRRMLSFAFSNSNLMDNEDVLIRRTDDFVNTVGNVSSENGQKGIDILTQFSYVTFNIMGEMSFGDSFDVRLKEQTEYRYHWADVIVDTTYMNDVMRAVCVIPGLFTFLEWLKTDHMRKTLYRHAEYATEHTDARLAKVSERKDFMYHILTSKGPRATNKEIASHFNVIMMAGAVTTATFLAGTMYYLGQNRAALARLQDEMRSRFSKMEDINSKELLKCEYLNAVVEEGLRIYPPAGAGHLSRIVPEGGCEISGVFVPEGTRVSVHQWSVIRDEDNFHDPSAFIPERWLKNEVEGQKGDKLETSLPFSYGPRGCLGRNLAYLEMRMVLAKMFWKYDLEWTNGDLIDWERDSKGYTLWEKPQIRAILRDRLDA